MNQRQLIQTPDIKAEYVTHAALPLQATPAEQDDAWREDKDFYCGLYPVKPKMSGVGDIINRT